MSLFNLIVYHNDIQAVIQKILYALNFVDKCMQVIAKMFILEPLAQLRSTKSRWRRFLARLISPLPVMDLTLARFKLRNCWKLSQRSPRDRSESAPCRTLNDVTQLFLRRKEFIPLSVSSWQ